MLKYFIAVISISLAAFPGPREWLISYGTALLSLVPIDAGRANAPAQPLLSADELASRSGGAGSKGLYLAILGQVFDVEKGHKHYGPGGGYRFFTGRDASRAFVTGDFTEEGLSSDVSDLSPSQIVALYDWLTFYQKEYNPVGRLVGRYYSGSGEPTDALRQVEALLSQGQRLKAQAQAESQIYPGCNSEWSATNGGRVWCSTKSGGVSRDWSGVPRMLFSPALGRSRCVCVQLEDPTRANNPHLQEYKGCPSRAESCVVHDD